MSALRMHMDLDQPEMYSFLEASKSLWIRMPQIIQHILDNPPPGDGRKWSQTTVPSVLTFTYTYCSTILYNIWQFYYNSYLLVLRSYCIAIIIGFGFPIAKILLQYIVLQACCTFLRHSGNR